MLPQCLMALCLGASTSMAQKAGTFENAGSTLVSAMMMFLGTDETVYIVDKAENNPTQINGHPAWAVSWDIASRTPTTMDFRSNAFCASGMQLPDGSFSTFGGNGAIGPGGEIGSVKLNGNGAFDDVYKDADGTTAIRVLSPCKKGANLDAPECQWKDDAAVTMQKRRWYSTAESTADGSIVLIGGFTNGGYINRNYPNIDPEFEGGAAESTYEFYPPNGRIAARMDFMVKTSGLNSYSHAYLMPSGQMFVQANFSTILWDFDNNVETNLPDMPGRIIRVYPASGATAMLPLRPSNKWTPTMLFCGGTDINEADWGDYSFPRIDTWDYPASRDCQRITPERTDGKAAFYEQDDDMPESRTMGQFVTLPDGKMLVIEGGVNGTAGYSKATGLTPTGKPFGMSLASGPIGRPAIYDPEAPAGSRWSTEGLGTSEIPRLYHSTAILLPDGSVMVAGSNPNVDVDMTSEFPTTYTAEIFYPPYFAKPKPQVTGFPEKLTYGGAYFDVTIPAGSYSGVANDVAAASYISLVRTGFSTHGMSMGQRFLQLENTFTVKDDGSIVLHVSQVPPNANLLTPGPVLMFAIVAGVPSNGKMIIVGSGKFGVQLTARAAALPASVLSQIAPAGNESPSSNHTADPGTGSGASKNNKSSASSTAVGTLVTCLFAMLTAASVAL